MNAAPCIRSGISALSLSELLSFPVAESLRLADFLMEEVGVDFLQAHILDAEFLSHILQLDEISRLEIASAMQLQEVIMPRQSHFRHPFILQESDDGWCHTREIQAEEIAYIAGTHLQQRHLEVHTLGETWSCLRIHTQNILSQEIFYSGICIFSLIYHYHIARKENSRQAIDSFLFETSENYLHYCYLFITSCKISKKSRKKGAFLNLFC